MQESNLRPAACKAVALTPELITQLIKLWSNRRFYPNLPRLLSFNLLGQSVLLKILDLISRLEVNYSSNTAATS